MFSCVFSKFVPCNTHHKSIKATSHLLTPLCNDLSVQNINVTTFNLLPYNDKRIFEDVIFLIIISEEYFFVFQVEVIFAVFIIVVILVFLYTLMTTTIR